MTIPEPAVWHLGLSDASVKICSHLLEGKTLSTSSGAWDQVELKQILSFVGSRGFQLVVRIGSGKVVHSCGASLLAQMMP